MGNERAKQRYTKRILLTIHHGALVGAYNLRENPPQDIHPSNDIILPEIETSLTRISRDLPLTFQVLEAAGEVYANQHRTRKLDSESLRTQKARLDDTMTVLMLGLTVPGKIRQYRHEAVRFIKTASELHRRSRLSDGGVIFEMPTMTPVVSAT